MGFIQARIAPFLTKFQGHKVEAGLLFGSIASCLAGLTLLILSFTAPAQNNVLDYSKAPNEESTAPQPASTESKKVFMGGVGEIAADIAGAVNRPGVYYLPQPARLNDLLKKAEGLSEQADHIYVSRTLNLAKTITDQEKIYIPSLGEEAPELSSIPPSSARVQNPVISPSEGPLININLASKAELEELPGIGQITAERIIEGRPYSTIEELSRNGVLRPKVFLDIKAKISI